MENNIENKLTKSLWEEVFDWIQAIVVAIVIAMFLRTYIFTMVDVSGSSMVPTLHNKDKLFVWRLGYQPEVNDIIIFRPAINEKTPYVKRVIATEGQSVDLRYNPSKDCVEVYVDGEKLDEPYINERIKYTHIGDGNYPCIVPEDCLFVMGDNRNNSADSRLSSIGMVHKDSVVGKTQVRLWPLNQIGGLK